jgi:DNA-binding NtrC family response regulator
VGSKKSVSVDIRFIAATNMDIKAMVTDGTFREDLYYRLNIFPIQVPALRQRKEDIPLLAYHFLTRFSEELGREVKNISAQAMSILINQDWPGNVRELENAVHRAVLLCEGNTITPGHLAFVEVKKSPDVPRTIEELKRAKKNLRAKSIEKIERSFLVDALQRNDWNISRAARDVGMQRTNFHSLLKKHRITIKENKSNG